METSFCHHVHLHEEDPKVGVELEVEIKTMRFYVINNYSSKAPNQSINFSQHQMWICFSTLLPSLQNPKYPFPSIIKDPIAQNELKVRFASMILDFGFRGVKQKLLSPKLWSEKGVKGLLKLYFSWWFSSVTHSLPIHFDDSNSLILLHCIVRDL